MKLLIIKCIVYVFLFIVSHIILMCSYVKPKEINLYWHRSSLLKLWLKPSSFWRVCVFIYISVFVCVFGSWSLATGPWGPVWPDPFDVLCAGWPPGLCRDSAEGRSLGQQDGPQPAHRPAPRRAEGTWHAGCHACHLVLFHEVFVCLKKGHAGGLIKLE